MPWALARSAPTYEQFDHASPFWQDFIALCSGPAGMMVCRQSSACDATDTQPAPAVFGIGLGGTDGDLVAGDAGSSKRISMTSRESLELRRRLLECDAWRK